MNITSIKSFLQKSVKIINDYHKKTEDEGTAFNIFSILKVASSEVRLHSRFIAELLDSKGSHTMKNLFFKIFINRLELNDDSFQFNIDNYTVEVEKNIDRINKDYTEGGRIDIYIEDNNDYVIIIENKIYAVDQNNQLLRYKNYAENNNKNYKIIYLTLDGKESYESVEDKCISYKEEISEWLEDCIQSIKSLKITTNKKEKLSNTIRQYKEIISYYLIPSNQNAMTQELEKLFRNNTSFIHHFKEIQAVYDNLVKNVQDEIYSDIGKILELDEKDEKPIHTFDESGYELRVSYDFDDSFLFAKLLMYKNNKDINTGNKFFKSIIKYIKDPKIIDKSFLRVNLDIDVKFHNSINYIKKYPEFFDTMLDDNKRREFIIQNIKPKFDEIVNNFKSVLERNDLLNTAQ